VKTRRQISTTACLPVAHRAQKLDGKLHLCVQRARAVLASLVAQEVAWRQSSLQTGPHQVIRNPEVRLWWWRSFGSALLQTYGSLGTEEITWERFWSSFPKGLEE
jgi:hypothetical protein